MPERSRKGGRTATWAAGLHLLPRADGRFQPATSTESTASHQSGVTGAVAVILASGGTVWRRALLPRSGVPCGALAPGALPSVRPLLRRSCLFLPCTGPTSPRRCSTVVSREPETDSSWWRAAGGSGGPGCPGAGDRVDAPFESLPPLPCTGPLATNLCARWANRADGCTAPDQHST